jgi:hypothetical protein
LFSLCRIHERYAGAFGRLTSFDEESIHQRSHPLEENVMQARLLVTSAVMTAVLVGIAPVAHADNAAQTVAALDTAYQSAVERYDWQAMDRLLHRDFMLVLGNGVTYTREQVIDSSRNRKVLFDKQVEVPGTQVVRLYGDNTATVSALLWLKGKRADNSANFDYKVWFSDTYVRTRDGWEYAFGQASSPMPMTKDSK